MWYLIHGDHVSGLQGATTIIEHWVCTRRGEKVAKEMYLRSLARWPDIVDDIQDIRIKIRNG